MFRIQSTALSQSGDFLQVAPNAQITVRDKLGALADIFSDEAGAVPLSNPFSADASGGYDLYVAFDDFYDVTVTQNGQSVDDRIYPIDPAYLSQIRTDSEAAATATAADVILTAADAVATAADRVQTGLDATATAADRVQTGLDATATAADRVATGLDVTAADAAAATATAAAEQTQLAPTKGSFVADGVGNTLVLTGVYQFASSIDIYFGGNYLDPSNYTVANNGTNTTVTFDEVIPAGVLVSYTALRQREIASLVQEPENIAFADAQTLAQFYARLQTSQTDATAGAIYTLGAFGLGNSVPLTGATDLKDRGLKPGFYEYLASDVTGGPESIAFNHTLIVSQADFDGRRGLIDFRVTGTGPRIWFGSQSGDTGVITWSELFHKANIVGTVSQSGGVPTGAVIEQGGTATSRFTRYADGTMVCTKRLSTLGPISTASGSLFISGENQIGAWASTFSEAPSVAIISSSPTNNLSWVAGTDPATTTSGGSFYLVRQSSSSLTTYAAEITATGRWY